MRGDGRWTCRQQKLPVKGREACREMNSPPGVSTVSDDQEIQLGIWIRIGHSLYWL